MGNNGNWYDKARYNTQEYNRYGIDESGSSSFSMLATIPEPFGERYVASERGLADTIVCSVSVEDRMVANERECGFDIVCDMVLEVFYSQYLDLLPLIPVKFHDSQVLKDYLDTIGLYAGIWITQTADLQKLVDPYRTPEEYISYLAELIGYEIIHSDPSAAEKRNQLTQAIPWYKIKGSYLSVQTLMHLLNMTANIYDLYTQDYATFVRAPWFVGEEGENPPGIGPAYYKSPHQDIEVLLNVVYGSGSSIYLWGATQSTDLNTVVERVRPVNVVPHYYLLLNPATKETGQVITVEGQIKTTVFLTSWLGIFRYFDMGALGGDPTAYLCYNCHEYNDAQNHAAYNNAGENRAWSFDTGHTFDEVNSIFFNSVVKWKLGIGNKGVSPGSPGFSVQTPVLSGTITRKELFDDRAEFEFIVPTATVQPGVSELGLFLNDNTTLVLASTFPDIDKPDGIDLRVLVQVYK